MNMDPSVTSKSHSASDAMTEVNKKIVSGTSTIIDQIFPIFDQMTQNIQFPKIIYFFFQLIYALQLMFTSVWVSQNPLLDFSSNITLGLRSAQRYFFLLFIDNQSQALISFIIHTVVFALVLITYLFVIIYFHNKRRVPLWCLYPVKFVTENIIMIWMHPMGVFFSHSVTILLQDGFSAIYLVFSILVFIYYVCFAVVFNYSQSLMSSSAYIVSNYLTSFNMTPVIILTIGNPLLAAVYYLFNIFESWTKYPVVIIHFILVIWFIFSMRYMPFIDKFSNIFFFGIAIMLAVLDIYRLLAEPLNDAPDIVYPILIAVMFVIGITIGYFTYNAVVKKAKKALAYNQQKNKVEAQSDDEFELINMTDDEKTDRMIEIKVDNEARASYFLHYGLQEICDMFTDFTLIKFISQQQTSTETLLQCIKVIVLFPNESRLLNFLFTKAIKKRDLSLNNRFLLFQVSRIKILRQSSSSFAASEKLNDLKQITKSTEEIVRSFWLKNEANASTLREINNKIVYGRSLWEETLKNYPNSHAFHDEYTHYLIECCTDFETAIKHHHIGDMIETGRNFSTDYCFRSLIRTYPKYLKGHVVDLKGQFIKKGAKKGSTNNSNNNMFDSSASSTVDVRIEEEIGRTIITQSKMRLALQRATMHRKANNSKMMVASTIWTLVFGVALFSTIFFIFSNFFNDRYNATKRALLANRCEYTFILGTLLIIMDWGNQTGRTNYSVIGPIPPGESSAIDVSSQHDYISEMLHLNVESRDYYDQFLNEITQLALEAVDVYSLTVVVLQEEMNITYCRNGIPKVTDPANLKTVLTFSYMTQSMLSSNTDYANWWNNTLHFCLIMSEIPHLATAFETMQVSLANDQFNTLESTQKLLNMLTIVIAIITFILILVPFLIFCILYLRETQHFVDLLLSVEEANKKQAVEFIRKNVVEDEQSTVKTSTTNTTNSQATVAITLSLIIITIIGLAGFIIGMMLQSRELNNKLGYMASWSYKNAIRSNLAVYATISIYSGIFLSGDVKTQIQSEGYYLNRAKSYIDKLRVYQNDLVTNSDGIISIIGFDPQIDSLMNSETCVASKLNSTLHELYRCGSNNQLLSFLENFVSDAVSKISQYHGYIDQELTANIQHILINHVLLKLQAIDERLTELMTNFMDEFSTTMILLYVFGLVLLIITLIVMVMFIRILDSSYNAALILLRRLSPIVIVNSQDLVSYLLNRSSSKKNSEMTTSRAIIHNSSDGIILLGISGIVESVNPSVTHILGYTPEQLLGQPITTIAHESEHERLQTQITLMVNKQSATTYEDHFICISDSDTEVPCYLTILGMTGSNKDIESFVVIMQDETILQQQQKEAEEAKKQSETLLYQILPRDIVVRLNQGEKDISFSVPSATIMFIDIVKFSEYSAQLTPQEIMRNLSTLFGAFDESLSKYPLLTKIKLIGDVYMCAAGLFNPDDPPSSHAEQMIKFALDALQVLDDTNLKLNANLSVRIGVNSGGPLIAGVLGTDKPVFDIIGDTINVASRLQSTDIPGRIQISQETFDLVNGLDFQIEPRGEVFLKGKGKTQAYLVRPANTFAFQLSSQDMGSKNNVTQGVKNE